MKRMSFVFIVVAALVACSSSSKLKGNRQYLKEYAFCKCFQFASGDTSYFINDASLSMYADLANYNNTVYEKIDSLVSRNVSTFPPNIIADYENKKAVFWNCFKFYKSNQLDSAVKKMDKESRRSWK